MACLLLAPTVAVASSGAQASPLVFPSPWVGVRVHTYTEPARLCAHVRLFLCLVVFLAFRVMLFPWRRVAGGAAGGRGAVQRHPARAPPEGPPAAPANLLVSVLVGSQMIRAAVPSEGTR